MNALLSIFLTYVLLHQATTSMGTSTTPSGLGPCDRPDSKPATCEDTPDLQCHIRTYIQVCNWATMEVVEVKCIYNHFAKRCQPSRKWDIYVSRTPCEVHKGKTTCELATSPESLYYATRRTCQWTTVTGKPDAQGMCISPESAFFYLLATDGSIFRVDPYQKQLQYVRQEESITAIASDANEMTGMFMAKHDKSTLKLMYLSNIEIDATPLQSLNVDIPHNNRHAGLGENIDGSILTATDRSVYLFTYNPDRHRKNSFTELQPSGCHLDFSGDLAGHPRSKHSTSREQHIFMLSEGQLVQMPQCKAYKPVDDKLTALAFTCNGELYAGTGNTIYRIHFNEHHQPDRAEEIITLDAHTIRDFASQSGCNLHHPRRRS